MIRYFSVIGEADIVAPLIILSGKEVAAVFGLFQQIGIEAIFAVDELIAKRVFAVGNSQCAIGDRVLELFKLLRYFFQIADQLSRSFLVLFLFIRLVKDPILGISKINAAEAIVAADTRITERQIGTILAIGAVTAVIEIA